MSVLVYRAVRRSAAVVAAVVLVGGWLAVEAAHNHAHRDAAEPDHHAATSAGGPAIETDPTLDAEGAGNHHQHIDLAATAPSKGPHQIVVPVAHSTAELALPGTGRVLRTDPPGDPPPPRARGSPFAPPSRGPPVS